MVKLTKILKHRAVIATLAIFVGLASGGAINPATVQTVSSAVVVIMEAVNETDTGCQ